MTNNLIAFLNSIFFHLFLLAILTIDFSIFAPKPVREKIVPIEFVSLPRMEETRLKKSNDFLSKRIDDNIKIEKESKKTIEVNKNKMGLNSLESLRKQIEDTKLSKEKKEVQIRISLIQGRINSIWKKPPLINEDLSLIHI